MRAWRLHLTSTHQLYLIAWCLVLFSQCAIATGDDVGEFLSAFHELREADGKHDRADNRRRLNLEIDRSLVPLADSTDSFKHAPTPEKHALAQLLLDAVHSVKNSFVFQNGADQSRGSTLVIDGPKVSLNGFDAADFSQSAARFVQPAGAKLSSATVHSLSNPLLQEGVVGQRHGPDLEIRAGRHMDRHRAHQIPTSLRPNGYHSGPIGLHLGTTMTKPSEPTSPLSDAKWPIIHSEPPASTQPHVASNSSMLQLKAHLKSVVAASTAKRADPNDSRMYENLKAHRTQVARLQAESAHLQRILLRSYRGRSSISAGNSDQKVLRAISVTMFACYACFCLYVFYQMPRLLLNTVLVQHKDAGSHLIEAGGNESISHTSGGSSKFVAEGNIFRLVARETEKIKHASNMQKQLYQLANVEFNDLLDNEAEGDADDPGEARYVQILRLLEAKMEKEVKAVSAGEGQFPALPILLQPKERIDSYLCGLILIPRDHALRERWLKDRGLSCLIWLIMTAGPALIIYNNWFSDYNHLVHGSKIIRDPVRIFCTDSVSVLAALFMYVIYEVVRFYTFKELRNYDKMKYLPADSWWLRLGQIANMVCIVGTAFSMPLIFWGELMAKDIVYDSMGLLFIFAMDDLGGSALSYLGMGDDLFQLSYMEFIDIVEDCPIVIADLVNPRARSANEIWDFTLKISGSSYRYHSHAGELVHTRYHHQNGVYFAKQGNGDWAILTPQGKTVDFHPSYIRVQYSVVPGRSIQLQERSFRGITRALWWLVYFYILFSELFVPVIFMMFDADHCPVEWAG